MKVVLADPVRSYNHTIETPSPWRELDDAVKLYQGVREKVDQADQNIEVTRRAIDAAQRERQDKLAAAVLDGGRVPQKDEVAAAEQKHADAIERHGATVAALVLAFERIEALIEQNRAAWLGSAAVAETDATAAYGAAVEAVAAAREQMLNARVHRAFIAGFPERKAGWIPDATTIAVGGSKLPWDSVELALKREAGTAKPEPRTLPEQVAALRESADAETVAA